VFLRGSVGLELLAGGLALGVALLTLLGEQVGVDVRQDTSGGNGHSAEQTVQLLVVADGQLNVAGHNARALVVARGVSGQLQDLGRQVLQHGGQVHGRSGSDALGVAALAQVAVDAGSDR
jgi:hypothetical protein